MAFSRYTLCECGRGFTRVHGSQRRCPDCQKAHQLTMALEYKHKHRDRLREGRTGKQDGRTHDYFFRVVEDPSDPTWHGTLTDLEVSEMCRLATFTDGTILAKGKGANGSSHYIVKGKTAPLFGKVATAQRLEEL